MFLIEVSRVDVELFELVEIIVVERLRLKAVPGGEKERLLNLAAFQKMVLLIISLVHKILTKTAGESIHRPILIKPSVRSVGRMRAQN